MKYTQFACIPHIITIRNLIVLHCGMHCISFSLVSLKQDREKTGEKEGDWNQGSMEKMPLWNFYFGKRNASHATISGANGSRNAFVTDYCWAHRVKSQLRLQQFNKKCNDLLNWWSVSVVYLGRANRKCGFLVIPFILYHDSSVYKIVYYALAQHLLLPTHGLTRTNTH